MDSNEIMELIEGAKSMTETKPTVKTELTRNEVEELLNLYQVMDDILQDASEIFDIDLSKLRRLRDSQHTLKQMFDFRPRTDSDGSPNHWRPYVMPDDDRAWFHTPKED